MLTSDPALFVFGAMSAGTSTSEGEHLVVQALNVGTGEIAWSADLSATLGVDQSWASLYSLTALSDQSGVVAVIEADDPQSAWLVRLGRDGRLADKVQLESTENVDSILVTGDVVVFPQFDVVTAYDVADLAAGPAWQVPFTNTTGNEEAPENERLLTAAALTDRVVTVGLDQSDPGPDWLVLDVTSGDQVPAEDAQRLTSGMLLATQETDTWLSATQDTLQAVTAAGDELWPAVQCTGQVSDDRTPGWMPVAGTPGDLVPCLTGGGVDLLAMNTGEVSTTVSTSDTPELAFVVDHRLFTLSADGTGIYDISSGDELITSPVLVPPVFTAYASLAGSAFSQDGTSVYFNDGESLQGFDLTSGTVLWSLPYEGQVVIGGGHVIVLDLTSGAFQGLTGL